MGLFSRVCGRICGRRKQEDDVQGYLVANAGVNVVNGEYAKLGYNMDGVPCFSNSNGVLLHRYALASGRRYWYFSVFGSNLTQSAGDYYRVEEGTDTPPANGWNTRHCASGAGSAPVVRSNNTGIAACLVAPALEVHKVAENVRPEEAQSASATDESEVDDQGPRVDVDVLLLSGTLLATVSIGPLWSRARVKSVIEASLEKGMCVKQIVTASGIFENHHTVEGLCLVDGSHVHVVLQAAEVQVLEAGVPEVNGYYFRMDEPMNDAVCFSNAVGVLLFRFIFPNGAKYWYFSSQNHSLSSSFGDFYRVKTPASLPPAPGWVLKGCPLGKLPLPVLNVFASLPPEDDEVEAQ